jgi:hypothetical protein
MPVFESEAGDVPEVMRVVRDKGVVVNQCDRGDHQVDLEHNLSLTQHLPP